MTGGAAVRHAAVVARWAWPAPRRHRSSIRSASVGTGLPVRAIPLVGSASVARRREPLLDEVRVEPAAVYARRFGGDRPGQADDRGLNDHGFLSRDTRPPACRGAGSSGARRTPG